MPSPLSSDPSPSISSPLDPDLLEILACPETHQPVRLAPDDLTRRLQAEQQAGRLLNRAGQPVGDAFEALLIREDGVVAYPVVDGIPVMLVNEAIPIEPNRASRAV